MFPRVASFFLLATLSILAAATTTVSVAPATSTPLPASQCSQASLQCCNALERADDSLVGIILGLLGAVVQGVEVVVGITCSPINILGIGENSCAQQAVCCENTDFSGIIAIGCVPININL